MTYMMGTGSVRRFSLLILAMVGLPPALGAEVGEDHKPVRVLTVAVLDFESGDKQLAPLGPQVGSLMTTFLSTESHLITVEREVLGKILSEQELGLSGTVTPNTASKVGRLTGAKVIITGRVFAIEKELIMVAKIISTETSRVFGETVRINVADSAADAAEMLARKVAKSIAAHGDALAPKVEPREDVIARLKEAIKGRKLPTVSVEIEERHNGRDTIDPAAETEVGFILQQVGFTVVDALKTVTKPDITIVGEGLSEFGTRRGDLISCRGRVEIKAIDRATGTILAIDRQTEVALDLGEQIAAKKALEQAATRVMARIVVKLTER